MIDSRFGSRKLLAHRVGFALALSAGVLVSAEALAQEACGESTCAKGTVCETVSSACPEIACVGPDCRPCVPTETSYCAPAPCTLDSECGPDQVCAEQTQTDCSSVVDAPAGAPACPPGVDCAEAPPAEKRAAPSNCTTITVNYCTPRWLLPCTAAADCGAGFECVPRESCWGGGTGGSSGSAPSGPTPTPGSKPGSEDGGAPLPEASFAPLPPADSAEAPAPGSGGGSDAAPPRDAPTTPPPTEVICEPTGVSMCKRIEVACSTDADCLSGWTCRDNPEGVCWSSPDGSSGCSADPAKVCLPANWGDWGRVGYADAGSSESWNGTGSGNPGSPSGPDTPTTSAPTAPTPVPPSQANDDQDRGGESASDALRAENGGCAMGSTRGSTALGWLALGLSSVFALRRRRG